MGPQSAHRRAGGHPAQRAAQLADVRVYTDKAGVTELYAIMARDNHSFARFNKIGLDQDGNPDPDDLQLAWAAGARAFQLTLRGHRAPR